MPPSQASETGNCSNDAARQSTRRKRTVISCNECHRRKQKCNRQQPCNQCIGRKVENLCVYTTPVDSAMMAAAAETATSSTAIWSSPSDHSSPGTGIKRLPSTSEYSPSAYFTSSTVISRKHRSTSDNSESENNNSNADYSDSSVEDDQASDEDPNETLGFFKSGVSNIAKDIAELKLSPSSSCGNWIARRARESKTLYHNSEAVSRILRTMPPRPYVELLVKLFFSEADFYQMINPIAFWDSLRQWWEQPDRQSSIATPMLTFRLMSIAIQFVPKEHLAQIRQIDNSIENLSRDYSAAASDLAVLLPDCIEKVLEGLLRAAWLKYQSRMKESWYCLATVIRMAQEIKLHIEEPDTPLSYERERRRRLWWTIYHWDGGMGLVLGRPTMIADNVWNVPLPLDLPNECYYPVCSDQSITSAPAITPFTCRLLSFKLNLSLSDLDTDPNKLYKYLTLFTASLPACWAVYNPDTSLDEQYPFLDNHREFLAASICMMLCALHRRKVPVPNPLSFCLRFLTAADRILALSEEHHYRQFMIAYQNLEPSVLICREILNMSGRLAEAGFVMWNDKSGDTIDVWQCLTAVESALARLRKVRKVNKVAAKAHLILKELLRRVKVQVQKEMARYAQLPATHNVDLPQGSTVSNGTSATMMADVPGNFSFFPGAQDANLLQAEQANVMEVEEPIDESVLKVLQRFDLDGLAQGLRNEMMLPELPPWSNQKQCNQTEMPTLPGLAIQQQQQLVEHQIFGEYVTGTGPSYNGEPMMFAWGDELDLSIEQTDMGIF
ncbi:fungal-specific transcription factor domain-containing protein [Lipomyces kononenkoae]|uniref:Fungal-specific transcription factor domain-containing protein n=1 Tax=Lipomyces kononenkoae TaxID=34357 RepID=A0ACC3SVL4_LIPKO